VTAVKGEAEPTRATNDWTSQTISISGPSGRSNPGIPVLSEMTSNALAGIIAIVVLVR
jgi:hypothetical protein